MGSLKPTSLIANWLQAGTADARQRGLPELEPLLEGLAQSLAALRAADAEHAAEQPPSPAAQGPAQDDDERS
jgi:hypothetical protein